MPNRCKRSLDDDDSMETVATGNQMEGEGQTVTTNYDVTMETDLAESKRRQTGKPGMLS